MTRPLQLAQHHARPVELRALATRAHFGEAGPLQLELLGGQIILDADAAALEGAAASDEVIGYLQCGQVGRRKPRWLGCRLGAKMHAAVTGRGVLGSRSPRNALKHSLRGQLKQRGTPAAMHVAGTTARVDVAGGPNNTASVMGRVIPGSLSPRSVFRRSLRGAVAVERAPRGALRMKLRCTCSVAVKLDGAAACF